MARVIKKFYTLESQHLVIVFYQFKDFIRYIKKYPESRIVRTDKSSRVDSVSVVYRRGSVNLFNFTSSQKKKLKAIFKERVSDCDHRGFSKYQERKVKRGFVNRFNCLNYFQQQNLIKARANFRRRCDSSFYEQLRTSEEYVLDYVNYLKKTEGIQFKPNPML